MEPIILGEGRLSWPSSERVSDRYGTVMLMVDGDSFVEPSGYRSIDQSIVGQRGSLIAEVLETRESSHIGDFFRGLFPETPTVGERIVLGTGTASIEKASWGPVDLVGLRPDEYRQSDWLDPKAMYRCHEQTVRLSFEAQDGVQ